MDYLIIITASVIALGVLVTIHEYGHFWVARRCGVKVLRFSIGFGKPLFGWRDKKGTEFVVAAIPLGGYVKMLDEREGEVPDEELHCAFNRKSVWQRIAVVLAGPMANFIFAIFAFWLVKVIGIMAVAPVIGDVINGSIIDKSGIIGGQEILAIDGEQISTWRDVSLALSDRLGESGVITIKAVDHEKKDQAETTEYSIEIAEWLQGERVQNILSEIGIKPYSPEILPIFGDIIPGSPADQAGLRTDDRVIEVDGNPIASWEEWVNYIQKHVNKPVSLLIQRNGSEKNFTLVPEPSKDDASIGYAGIALKLDRKNTIALYPESMRKEVRYSVFEAWGPALQSTYDMSLFILASLKKMIVGEVSVKNLGGVVTIARVAGSSFKAGFIRFVEILALLSLSLGILNLLPIPVLDGGHLLYYLVELVTRRPVPENVQILGFKIGILLLVGVMLLALYNDLFGL